MRHLVEGRQRLTLQLRVLLAAHAELRDAADEFCRLSLTKSTKRTSPLKSTSPLLSSSNMSMTRCTSGFCCSSGSDMNSSTLSAPLPSRSSFLKRRASRRSSSASTGE